MTKLEKLKDAFDKAFLLVDELEGVAWYAEHDQRGYGAAEAWANVNLALAARDNAWAAYNAELKKVEGDNND